MDITWLDEFSGPQYACLIINDRWIKSMNHECIVQITCYQCWNMEKMKLLQIIWFDLAWLKWSHLLFTYFVSLNIAFMLLKMQLDCIRFFCIIIYLCCVRNGTTTFSFSWKIRLFQKIWALIVVMMYVVALYEFGHFCWHQGEHSTVWFID